MGIHADQVLKPAQFRRNRSGQVITGQVENLDIREVAEFPGYRSVSGSVGAWARRRQ